MSYKEKPQIKLYKYEDSAFVLQAIIDDFAECSFENNRFQAGQFSITINYNIPNALLFERGLWVQFGNNPYAFGEILNITDSIGEDGKGSQIRVITGYDARYIFKRRVIKNLNNVENWSMTAKGEIVMRNLIKDQCGSGAETKRQLPITNVIPDVADAIGAEYSVAESFTNLYEVLVTIATQSEIGWRLNFSGSLTLEFYSGVDRHTTVRFDTNYESLSNGEFKDSAEAFANTIYVGGKGTGADRDLYEGESAIEGESPAGLDRFEAYDNQSNMTTESEYEAEALSMLNQYGQTLQVSGQGLAKCPYEYGQEYNVGDIITIAFSGKSAVVQILSVTEHWAWGSYDLEFSFGKPQPDLNKQLQLILKQIQKASNKTETTNSVRWYTIPTDTAQSSGDVVYNTIGFQGACAENGSTFTLYLDNEKTGAKTYHVYFKQLGGGKLTLTTGKAGASNLVMNSGTYVAIVYVDAQGNVTMAGATTTTTIEAGNKQPVSSEGVKTLVGSLSASSVGGSGKYISAISETDGVISATASDLVTMITSSVDLNTMVQVGVYATATDAIGNGCSNIPVSTPYTFFLNVSKSTNLTTLQVFTDSYGNRYDRTSFNGGQTWNAWQPFTPVDSVTSGNMHAVTSNAVYPLKTQLDTLYTQNQLNLVQYLPYVPWQSLPSQSTYDPTYFKEWIDWMYDHHCFDGENSYTVFIGQANPNYRVMVWGYTYGGTQAKVWSAFRYIAPSGGIGRFGYYNGSFYCDTI